MSNKEVAGREQPASKYTSKEDKWIKENFGGLGDAADGRGTVSKATDYGEIVFQGAAKRAKGKFIRIKEDALASQLFHLCTKIWKMEMPKLLISVTGGAKSFKLHPKLKTSFGAGLLKVAQTPGAWVITGGTNTGVMKHVGEALQGATKACIGIATWGILTNNETLTAEDTQIAPGGKFPYRVANSLVEKGAFLDHNHTHFLLVDDGSTGKFGVEIPFRSSFERFIMESSKVVVPSVLLVLEGGPGTVGTIVGAVTEDPPIPVVIIKDSGRASDFLAYALDNFSDEVVEGSVNNELRNLIAVTFPELKTVEKREKLYEQIVKCLKRRNLFTVFQMGGSSDGGLDEAILAALLKTQETSLTDQLQLTILWDRADLAQEMILSNITDWTTVNLTDLMIMALALDRVEFVKLLLSYSVSVSTLLTNPMLEFLYGFRSRINTSTLRYEFLDTEYTRPTVQDPVIDLLCSYSGFSVTTCAIPRKVIHRVVNQLCNRIIREANERFIEQSISSPSNNIELKKMEQTFQYPFRELFFWALLNNMQEMAMYLWEFEEEGMNKALIGSEICNSLSENAASLDLPDELEQSLTQCSTNFKQLALRMLEECYRNNDSKTEKLITSDSILFPQKTCLMLAVDIGHLEFVSHSSVQTLLNDVWIGALREQNVGASKVLIGLLLPPYVVYKLGFRTQKELKKMIRAEMADENNDEDDADTRDDANDVINDINSSRKALVSDSQQQSNYDAIPVDQRKQTLDPELPWYKKLFEFYFKTPVVKFYLNLISYLIFLGLISYVSISKKETPGIAEWVLFVFVLSLTFEEISQLIHTNAVGVVGKLSNWISSKWNQIDALAITLFFVAFGLHWDKSTVEAAHVCYALDAGLWILRLLDVFFAHRILGPYVVMIYRMFIDMMYFLVILVVFLLAYGVTSISILNKPKSGWMMLRDVIFHPYFNIYGELFIDRDPENENTTRFGTPVLNSYGEPMAWILLGLYLLIANVLLLNLLIAIFNNTFTEVQDNSAQIWKFERYRLIIEYSQRPALVLPFSLLIYMFMILKWAYKMFKKCCQNDDDRDAQKKDIRSVVSQKEKEELIEFEIDCMATYIRSKRSNEVDESTKMTTMLLDQIDELGQTINALDNRLKQFETQARNKNQGETN